MKHYFLISMLALSSATALTSCSNNDVDLFDPAQIEADQKQKYSDNFVAELQSMGIQPDILVLRTERHLDDSMRMKVASFCNVDLECVVQSEDMPSIYEVPVNMQHQGLDAAILRKIGIPVGETPAMKPWHDFLDKQRNAKREVHIGLVGKYDLQDAYKSIRESLNLAGIYNDVKTRLHFVNSEEVTRENVGQKLDSLQGIIICPGFGQRGIEGKIIAAEYTRTHNIPTFGICLGMQMMVIEFARNVIGLTDANSREMDTETPHNVIDIMEEQGTPNCYINQTFDYFSCDIILNNLLSDTFLMVFVSICKIQDARLRLFLTLWHFWPKRR